ncbi:hypothetical protein DNU06_01635 [Putridiphycobacter roseus]|uniref:histidine kinase n=1 Tax=Putridiphycobacter roseus TaxID=2219161 RepID=A0A2W1N4Q1_9FLAO|nr:hypothetical protein [Putridiphycobacter roseus]PZE18560.1 hypothetical protein DNU06_01635 [Putridiphycobacter roseus]
MKSKGKFYLLFIVLIGLIIVSQGYTQYFLHHKRKDSITINLAERQGMLSQRVNQLSYRCVKYGGKYHQDLFQALKVWRISHKRIMAGVQRASISKTLDAVIYHKLQNTLLIINKIDSILANSSKIDNFVLISVNQLVDSFLPQMEVVVKAFEGQSDEKLSNLVLFEFLLTIVTLIVIFTKLGIVKPAFDKVLAQNKALKKIAWQQSHELRRPVANILGLIEILKSKTDITDKDLVETLDYLYSSTKELDEEIEKIVTKSNQNSRALRA